MALKRQDYGILLALVALVFLLRLPLLAQPFENDSSSFAYHARLILDGQPLYSSHHPGHHMPALYYLYALSFAVGGDNVVSIKLLLMIFTAVTVAILYLLGKTAVNRPVGLAAAVLTAVLFCHHSLAGTTSRIEQFVPLPQLAALFLLLLWQQKGHKPAHFFWIGLLGGITFLFKANYVGTFLLAGVYLLYLLWQGRAVAWRAVLLRGLWIVAGLATAVIPFLLYFTAVGSWSGFVDVFLLGMNYTQVSQEPLQSPIFIVVYPLALFAQNNLAVTLAGLAGFCLLLSQIVPRPTAVPMPAALKWIALAFALGFVETSFSRVYLHHYYLILIPTFTLLASWFVWQIGQALGKIGPAALFLFTAVALLISARTHYPYYTHYYGGYLTGRESYQQVLNAGLPAGVGQSMAVMQELGDYINGRTGPDDTIYYWSNLMELYYLADRRAPIDIIWPIYVEIDGRYEKIFTAEYILIGHDTPLGFDDTLPQWLQDGLATHYQLETTLYDQQIYRRLPNP